MRRRKRSPICRQIQSRSKAAAGFSTAESHERLCFRRNDTRRSPQDDDADAVRGMLQLESAKPNQNQRQKQRRSRSFVAAAAQDDNSVVDWNWWFEWHGEGNAKHRKEIQSKEKAPIGAFSGGEFICCGAVTYIDSRRDTFSYFAAPGAAGRRVGVEAGVAEGGGAAMPDFWL